MAFWCDRMDRKKLSILIIAGLLILCVIGTLLWFLLPVRENVKRELPAMVFAVDGDNKPDLASAKKTSLTLDGQWSCRRASPDKPVLEGRVGAASVAGMRDGETTSFAFSELEGELEGHYLGYGTFFDDDNAVWTVTIYVDPDLERFQVDFSLFRAPGNVYGSGVRYRVIAPASSVEEAEAVAGELNAVFAASE